MSTRQRSLDETIAWSHALLSIDEQRAFRRIDAFAAGFGLDASAAAAGDDELEAFDVPRARVVAGSKSLIGMEPAAGSTRYRMLETVRAFAFRQLESVNELAAVASRLGRFYVVVPRSPAAEG